jgi:hypothetical protein
VSTASCVFGAVLARSELAASVHARAERLREFYGPLGLDRVSIVAPGDCVVGQIGKADVALDPQAGMLVWGEQAPPINLFWASDRDLHALTGVTAAFVWERGRLRVVTNSAGPATVYAAEGDGVTAYATHAVAAAVIAGVELEVDEQAVPEFIALDYVGGERTLVRGVRALPAATVAAADGERSYWRPPIRWERVRAADAYDHTESAVIASAAERVGGDRAGLALTAGLDSSVAGAALRDAGAEVVAFTWGEADWPDVGGAAETAAALGFEHRVTAFERSSDQESLDALDRDARWCDGVTALSATKRHWPEDCASLVVGLGGETGRAFYYDAWGSLLAPRPGADLLVRQLGVRGRLEGASEEAIGSAERAVAGWVHEAIATGADDWTALDVLYAEQRMRRWGRSQMPPLEQNLVLLFTPVEVARGLVSQPLRARLGDEFQRRFLTERGLPIHSAPADLPDLGGAGLAARRVRHRLRRPKPVLTHPNPVDPLVRDIWRERPLASAWLRDEALADPLIRRTLGDEWAARAAEGFAAGEVRTAERALRAAGVVALERALAQLSQ